MKNEQSPTIQRRHSTWGGNLRLDVTSLGKASLLQKRQRKKLTLGKAPLGSCRCQQKNHTALAVKHNWCCCSCTNISIKIHYCLNELTLPVVTLQMMCYMTKLYLWSKSVSFQGFYILDFPHLDSIHYSHYASEVSKIISRFTLCPSNWEVAHFVPEYVLENWKNCLGCLIGLVSHNH